MFGLTGEDIFQFRSETDSNLPNDQLYPDTFISFLRSRVILSLFYVRLLFSMSGYSTILEIAYKSWNPGEKERFKDETVKIRKHIANIGMGI